MKKVLVLVGVFVLFPAGTALATDLDELLDQSQAGSYSAEQLISCDTPTGVQDVLIDLEQKGGEIRYGTGTEDELDTWSGFGAWAGPQDGSRIDVDASATTDLSTTDGGATYLVSDGDSVEYLGRSATSYRLTNKDVLRAELVVDDELGIFLSVTTYDASGATYCERRFVSLDPNPPDWSPLDTAEGEILERAERTTLPSNLGEFELLDFYTDESGITFAYYSDGFFSFAVFDSPVPIQADSANRYQGSAGPYFREYTPGQVTYTWTVAGGGMALIGDLPPDMHEAILAGLESPRDPGFFRRLWRSVFG